MDRHERPRDHASPSDPAHPHSYLRIPTVPDATQAAPNANIAAVCTRILAIVLILVTSGPQSLNILPQQKVFAKIYTDWNQLGDCFVGVFAEQIRKRLDLHTHGCYQ